MSTKRKGVGCYDKAGLDEPIFVLRAQDTLAPGIVRLWAEEAAKAGVYDKVGEALALADEMEAWARENGSKVPD